MSFSLEVIATVQQKERLIDQAHTIVKAQATDLKTKIRMVQTLTVEAESFRQECETIQATCESLLSEMNFLERFVARFGYGKNGKIGVKVTTTSHSLSELNAKISELVTKELAVLEKNSSDSMEIVAYYEKLQALHHQKTAEIQHGIARKLFQEGAYRDAAAIFEELTKNECDIDLKKSYIYCLVSIGEFEKAIQEIARLKPTLVAKEGESPKTLRMHELYFDFFKAKALGGQKKYDAAIGILQQILTEMNDDSVRSLIFYFTFLKEVEHPDEEFFLEASKQQFICLDQKRCFECEDSLTPTFEFYLFASTLAAVRTTPQYLERTQNILRGFMKRRLITPEGVLRTIGRHVTHLAKETDRFFKLYQTTTLSISQADAPAVYSKAIIDARRCRLNQGLFGGNDPFDSAGIVRQGLAYSELMKDAEKELRFEQDRLHIEFITHTTTLSEIQSKLHAYQKSRNKLQSVETFRLLLPELQEEKESIGLLQ